MLSPQSKVDVAVTECSTTIQDALGELLRPFAGNATHVRVEGRWSYTDLVLDITFVGDGPSRSIHDTVPHPQSSDADQWAELLVHLARSTPPTFSIRCAEHAGHMTQPHGGPGIEFRQTNTNGPLRTARLIIGDAGMDIAGLHVEYLDDGSYVHLAQLWTHPYHERCGHARRLLEHAEQLWPHAVFDPGTTTADGKAFLIAIGRCAPGSQPLAWRVPQQLAA